MTIVLAKFWLWHFSFCWWHVWGVYVWAGAAGCPACRVPGAGPAPGSRQCGHTAASGSSWSPSPAPSCEPLEGGGGYSRYNADIMIGHLDAGLPRLLAALLVRLLRALLVRDLVADLARDIHTHLNHTRVTTRALKVFSCSVHVSVCSHRDQAHWPNLIKLTVVIGIDCRLPSSWVWGVQINHQNSWHILVTYDTLKSHVCLKIVMIMILQSL